MRSALLIAAAAGAFVAGAIAFQPAQPHFIDITARSKFSYITNNDLSPRKYFVQPMAGGVAIFDYDNDGRMDIFFTNGAK
ncbi:MAG TPA: CRTAC1 family protein, partial [Bryobacteraceae bacterium]